MNDTHRISNPYRVQEQAPGREVYGMPRLMRNLWPVFFDIKCRTVGLDVALATYFLFRPALIGDRFSPGAGYMGFSSTVAILTLHIDQMGGHTEIEKSSRFGKTDGMTL